MRNPNQKDLDCLNIIGNMKFGELFLQLQQQYSSDKPTEEFYNKMVEYSDGMEAGAVMFACLYLFMGTMANSRVESQGNS